jgi:SAM-dependent methyltransferase
MRNNRLFKWLANVNCRPEPYSKYTTVEMWSDEHISKGMLSSHLDENTDSASRNKAFIQRSIDWTKRYFSIGKSTRIIDFGCGPGLYTNEWARMGANVTGIDISVGSIEYAKRIAEDRNLHVKYICDNYLEYAFGQKYDLVTLIFCDYCVLNPQQRKSLLTKWRSIQKPNGKILFDVSTVKYFDSLEERRFYEYCKEGGFWSSEPHFAFYNLHRYEDKKLLLEQYKIIEKERIRTFYNWLQCFSLDTMKTELNNEGFEIIEIFGNVSGDAFSDESTEMALVVKSAI